MTDVVGDNGFRVVDDGRSGVHVVGPARVVEIQRESQFGAWRIIRPGACSDDFRQTKDLAVARAKELAV